MVREVGDAGAGGTAFDVVAVTVVLSVLCHGLTAGPLSAADARASERLSDTDAEMAPSISHRPRFGWRT